MHSVQCVCLFPVYVTYVFIAQTWTLNVGSRLNIRRYIIWYIESHTQTYSQTHTRRTHTHTYIHMPIESGPIRAQQGVSRHNRNLYMETTQ